MKKYESKEEINRKLLNQLLSELNPIDCSSLPNEGPLAKEKIVYDSKEALIDMIVSDIAFEEHVALEVYKTFKSILLKDYYWEISITEMKSSDFRLLFINLVFEPENENKGRLLFPIVVAKCIDGSFLYWEVYIDIPTAIESIELLQL